MLLATADKLAHLQRRAHPAETYRVLIASPSDLSEERQVAADAVNKWNAQHEAAESAVLLPVKWEMHATPRSGVRPQQAINDQLVWQSDILVGMFWTKVGTSTGVAESGTIEEIDQFVKVGKPAMLYFSRRPIDPDKIDLAQHRRLRSFIENLIEFIRLHKNNSGLLRRWRAAYGLRRRAGR